MNAQEDNFALKEAHINLSVIAGAGPRSFVLLSHLVYGSFFNVLTGKNAGHKESLF